MKICKAQKGFVFLGLLVALSCCNSKPDYSKLSSDEVHKLVLTLDSHCDTPLWLTYEDYDVGVRHDVNERQNRVDLPRMKEGGLDASFFAVFLGQGPRNDSANQAAWKEANEIIDKIEEQINKNDTVARIAYSPDDAYENEKNGILSIYMGLENGYPIGNDIARIDHFRERGIRYITLCHSRNNDICDSANDTIEFNGLSPFGELVVAEMVKQGLMIDLSHASDETFFDVINQVNVPVIASHSNSRKICDNPRNLSDSMLVALAANGGVVQVCILNSYVKTPPENPARDSAIEHLRNTRDSFAIIPDHVRDSIRNEWYAIQGKYPEVLATVSDVVDHIDHIVKVAGIDHVGIGTDFDGGGGLEDCYEVCDMANITKELKTRGYSYEDIEKIWGGNFMRVFRAVQEMSKIETL